MRNIQKCRLSLLSLVIIVVLVRTDFTTTTTTTTSNTIMTLAFTVPVVTKPRTTATTSRIIQQQQQELQHSLLLQQMKSSVKDDSGDNDSRYPIPVILVAGFLGTGKTTTLKHILENKEDRKVGVIVNDVAAVNIDAKLISSNPYGKEGITTTSTTTKDGVDYTMIDLQNGCVCCSLADEFFFSIENLITSRKHIDTVIVELSGVSDPMAMKNNWIMAPNFIKNKCHLAGIVTIVDAASFGVDYMSWDDTRDRPNWTNNSRQSNNAENDDDDYDNDIENGLNTDYDNGSITTRKVAELLVEQVEAADIIVLNKCDIADSNQIMVTESVSRALNKNAQIEQVQFGQLSSKMILDRLSPSNNNNNKQQQEHSHSHDEKKKVENKVSCTDPVCTDTTHTHNHDDTTNVENAKEVDGTCADPVCTDPTHNHDHSHSHSSSTNMAKTNHNVDIISFVYKSSRPFHAGRIMDVLNNWPVPIKDTLDIELLQNAALSGYEIKGTERRSSQHSPFAGVIRSKGFCWFAPYNWDTNVNSIDEDDDDDIMQQQQDQEMIDDTWRHDTAMYWSHAGRQFSISTAGQWWGTISAEIMKIYFTNNMSEYTRIRTEDFVSIEFGDRRQEIVFIGTGLNESTISSTLDACLLSDIEFDNYRTHVQEQKRLKQQSLQQKQQQRMSSSVRT